MSEINAKIIDQKIISTHITISREIKNSIDLKLSCQAKLKTPQDIENNSVLLNIKLFLATPTDDLKAELTADIIFELDYVPDDYNIIAEQKLIPLARTSLFEKWDEILVAMGYKKMRLADKISQ
ncbi:hypothetical protein NSA48_10495 [Frisingicoccus caecimuris]|uniref:Uncharacterized protein n=1 Tax=Frisingicoccus caecimuris TaxID=1796636 RepID=A0A4V2SDL3_9FIRM|nr:hypothetical protein [Frisingicoccus caecimuris]MCR1919462.1 hypothetical protein [Frisingicoccus caecimuris]TCO84038.1 hypothetical protein EV212_11061 [Frisingicoccus caecimuris]